MQFINPDSINRVLFLYCICIESIYMHCSGGTLTKLENRGPHPKF